MIRRLALRQKLIIISVKLPPAALPWGHATPKPWAAARRPSASADNMSKKAVFIIAQNNFRDEELLVPKEILVKNGITVKVAAKIKSKAIGKLGAEIQPDLALIEVKADDFEAIIFVGGSGASQYFDDISALNLARDFFGAKKITAGICIGPSILANAGVLMGKTATAFPSQEDNLKNKGADYTGMAVEIDGRVITGKDPNAAKEFGEKLVNLLTELD